MGYWSLTPSQEEILQTEIQGKYLLDLGAGDLSLARWCLEHGAQGVLAIEKDQSKEMTRKQPNGLEIFHGTFLSYLQKNPVTLAQNVALVSWPANRRQEPLNRILAGFPTVIYLGKNTDGTTCGDASLFRELGVREILRYVPDFRNTLVVYGMASVDRELFPEEVAAMDVDSIHPYSPEVPSVKRLPPRHPRS